MRQNEEVVETQTARLTGNQVKFIRTVLGESQAKFGKRLAISSASVFRLEAKGDAECVGPEIILIDQLVKRYGITVPDRVMNFDQASDV